MATSETGYVVVEALSTVNGVAPSQKRLSIIKIKIIIFFLSFFYFQQNILTTNNNNKKAGKKKKKKKKQYISYYKLSIYMFLKYIFIVAFIIRYYYLPI